MIISSSRGISSIATTGSLLGIPASMTAPFAGRRYMALDYFVLIAHVQFILIATITLVAAQLSNTPMYPIHTFKGLQCFVFPEFFQTQNLPTMHQPPMAHRIISSSSTCSHFRPVPPADNPYGAAPLRLCYVNLARYLCTHAVSMILL
jgi:hypothetical protein